MRIVDHRIHDGKRKRHCVHDIMQRVHHGELIEHREHELEHRMHDRFFLHVFNSLKGEK